MVLHLCGPPPTNTFLKSNLEKNFRQIPDEGSLQNTSAVILKTVRVIKVKGSLKNCHNQGEPKDTATEWTVVSKMAS